MQNTRRPQWNRECFTWKVYIFIRRGRENPAEVENLRMVQTDDDIFLCVGDWSDGYNTEILSNSEHEVESCGEWLIEGGRIVLVIA